MSLEDVRCRADIFKAAACTAGDDSLIHMEFSVSHFVVQGVVNSAVKAYLGFLFHITQDVVQVGVEFFNRIGVAGVERHGNHGSDGGEVHGYQAVIVGHVSGVEFLVFFLPAVDFVKFFDFSVCFPDR